MSTLIDDFNQNKMTNNNTYSAPSIVSPTTAEPTQNNVVKPKNKKLTTLFNKLISKASIKRLVKKIDTKKLIFAVVAIILVSIPIISVINNWSNADTGTQTIYPNADYGTLNNFAQTGGSPTAGNHCAAGTHCNYVDYNDSANTTYLGTGLSMDGTAAEEEFDFTDLSPIDGTLTQVTSVTVTVKARIITLAGGGTNADSLNVRLYINGAYNGTTNSATMSTTEASHTFTWNSLTATTASDIRAEIVRVANGTGGGTAKDDDFRIYEVKTSVNYTYSAPRSVLSLEGYTFENDDSISSPDFITTMAGSSFSSGKTLSAVRQGERLMLRAHITNSGGPLSSSTELGLFYDRGDGYWTQVKNQQKYKESSGSGCGASGSSHWTCTIVDDDTYDAGSYEDFDMAINSDGTPYIAYIRRDGAARTLIVARYVGSGGSGCGASGSTAWICTTIYDDGGGLGNPDYTSIAITPSGIPYIAFYEMNTTSLMVARYVGSGGTGCGASGSTAWMCTTVDNDTDDTGGYKKSITIDSSGKVYISYYDTSATSLMVARYVGSGGTGCGASGSTAWTCTTVDNDTDSTGRYNYITFSSDSTPYISYYDDSATSLMVAKYVGSGGTGCGASGSTAWTCTTVDNDTDNTGTTSSLAFSPDSTPYISYYDASATSLMMARYVGSGGSGCGASGSTAWTCTTVDNDTDNTGAYPSLEFSTDGTPIVSYNDTSATSLMVARYVGSGGTGCGASGSTAWTCTTVDNDTDSTGTNNCLVVSVDGTPIVSYYDYSAKSINITKFERFGEIQFSPSLSGLNSRSILKSHADMSSSGDSSNNGDADCLVSATWNNGILAAGPTIGGFTLPNGSSTKQCTELAWTIDTSQALPGTTYRFMIATNDSFRPDKGVWRGPVSIATDAYPTLTITPDKEQSYKYSKDVLGSYANNNCGSSGSNEWACTVVNNSDTDITGRHSSIAFAPDGTAYIAYNQSTDTALWIAKYVGSGGTGCGALGSNAWTCTVVDSDVTNSTGGYNTLAFSPDGAPYITYYDATTRSVMFAKYVGSGGTGCGALGSNAWTCTIVDNTTNSITLYSSMALNSVGIPYISYYSTLDSALKVAKYVGSGGTGCGATGNNEWTCTIVNDVSSWYTSIAFNSKGVPYISYFNQGNSALAVAKYVESGGTGCSGTTAWTCIDVDNDNTISGNNGTSIAFDNNDVPFISYADEDFGALNVAKYVGGTSGTGCGPQGSTAWSCTKVDDNTNTVGQLSSIAFSSEGKAYVRYYDSTDSSLKVARYVGGTSGTGCGDGSTEWSCVIVDGDPANITGGTISSPIAFSPDGTPYISYYNETSTSLMVAKLKTSITKPNLSVIMPYNGRNAGSGIGRYWLNSGTAPYGNWQGACGGTVDLMGYCGLYKNDGQYDSLTAQIGERPLYNMSTKFSSNSVAPTAKIYFKSSIAPSSSNVVVQAYRFGSTNAWETVKTVSSTGCTASNCYVEALPSGTAPEYYEQKGSDYWVYFRVFQNEDYSSGITFKLDMFRADQPQVLMRHGRVFRENLKDPFTFTR